MLSLPHDHGPGLKWCLNKVRYFNLWDLESRIYVTYAVSLSVSTIRLLP